MGHLHPTDFEQPGKGGVRNDGGGAAYRFRTFCGEILDVICRRATVTAMTEDSDSAQAGECDPAFGICRVLDKDQRNGN